MDILASLNVLLENLMGNGSIKSHIATENRTNAPLKSFSPSPMYLCLNQGSSTTSTPMLPCLHRRNYGESYPGLTKEIICSCYGVVTSPFWNIMAASSCQGIEMTKTCPRKYCKNSRKWLQVTESHGGKCVPIITTIVNILK